MYCSGSGVRSRAGMPQYRRITLLSARFYVCMPASCPACQLSVDGCVRPAVGATHTPPPSHPLPLPPADSTAHAIGAATPSHSPTSSPPVVLPCVLSCLQPAEFHGARVVQAFSFGLPWYLSLPLSFGLSPRIYREVK